MKKELIKQAGFSSTFEIDRLEKLIELTLVESFKIMSDPMTTNSCAYTTHDAGIVSCAVERAMTAIAKEFDINVPHDIKYKKL